MGTCEDWFIDVGDYKNDSSRFATKVSDQSGMTTLQLCLSRSIEAAPAQGGGS